MTPFPLKKLPGRQVHLDFHTSPLIPDLLAEFDAERWADTLARAHVDSVTVFAKGHHGQTYFPTALETEHPGLGGRDLLGEQIAALHARGIRAPIYTTVGWEERLADLHPEWRQRDADGVPVQMPTRGPGDPLDPDLWRFLCYHNPDYQDHLEKHLREVCERYGPDGLWLDIVFYGPGACFCDACRRTRQRHGWEPDTEATRWRLQEHTKGLFAERFTDLIKGLVPQATVFYNSDHRLSSDPCWGLRPMDCHVTHWEVESLPNGHWGYAHFPRVARHVATLGKPWLGMTGRFQRMWGDFGGLKPQAALEYECFRAQALGGGCSVGDQLPPRGRLDPAAYDLIGAVYRQVEAAEPFYAGAVPLARVGVVLAGHPDRDGHTSMLAEEGAATMLDEMHEGFWFVDPEADLSSFDLVVLPDHVVVGDALAEVLAAFHAAGGAVLASYRAGFDVDGRWRLPWMPVEVGDDVGGDAAYWRADEAFWPSASSSDHVVYEPGAVVTSDGAARVLARRVAPYFERTPDHFMSHFQAPPVADASGPAVVAGERWAYLADPVFSGYRRHGAPFYCGLVARLVRRLVGPPPVGEGLPVTVRTVAARRGDDLAVTLLHYVPSRKAVEGDTVDEPLQLGGETLVVRGVAPGVGARVFGGDALVEVEAPDGARGWALPLAKGRLLVELPGFFS